MPEITHSLHVRTANGKRLAVAVRPIASQELAVRFGLALQSFLAEPDVEFISAARWAFQVRDAIEEAGLDREKCAVEVVKRTVTGAGKRSRVVVRFPVAEVVAVSARAA